MPFGIPVGAPVPSGLPTQFGSILLRIGGVDISTFISFRYSQHFLSPTSRFACEVAIDSLSDDARAVLVPGSKVEIFIDNAKQFTGYIEAVDTTHNDRHSGNTVLIDGRDAMMPLVQSQIDPTHHYPDNTPLEKLLRDIAGEWFTKFDVTNDENVLVQANLALKQKRAAGKSTKTRRRRHSSPKALKQYPLPKSKPEHNDSYYQFLSRILNRLGLWPWTSADGDTLIVGKPNFDQDPVGQLRRKFPSAAGGFGVSAGINLASAPNNIIRGGVRLDSSEQPSFIVARGNIPPKQVEHTKTRVVIGNPYDDVIGRIIKEADRSALAELGDKQGLALGESGTSFSFLDTKPRPPRGADDSVARILAAANVIEDTSLTSAHETGTFITPQEKVQTVKLKWTTAIPVKPVEIRDVFASPIAKPRFLTDRHSRTIDELTRFAKRQMSLCTRKAFIGKYTFAGFKLDDAIPVVDTIVGVDDDVSNFHGPLWVIAREVTLSRGAGAQTSLELVPLNSIQL